MEHTIIKGLMRMSPFFLQTLIRYIEHVWSHNSFLKFHFIPDSPDHVQPLPLNFLHKKGEFPPLEFPSRDAYIKLLMRFFSCCNKYHLSLQKNPKKCFAQSPFRTNLISQLKEQITSVRLVLLLFQTLPKSVLFTHSFLMKWPVKFSFPIFE